MNRTALLLLPLAAVLGACDAATEIAGDTLESGVRGAVVAQCEELASGAGIAASRLSAVCQCSADKLKSDTDLSPADLSRERLQGIIDTCVAETDPDGVGQ
ncbi:hypothetical protein WAB17_10230 [Parerythrobacter aurantius]|uniref:hypothetical protein n=1 Tax=Parerythrobacter aurantius TaxID=3127706 RepID=UPI00324C8B16